MNNNSNSGIVGSDVAEPVRRTGLIVTMWRRRKLFAGVFCGVFALALLALAVLPVRFLATGAVIVAEQDPGVVNTPAVWAQKIGDPADLESQLLVIRSPRVLRLALAEPDIFDHVVRECRHHAENTLFGIVLGAAATCDKLAPGSDALIEYVQARYLVGSVGRSRVINISYQSPFPETARRMADALITTFLADQRTTLSTGREVAAAWLWQELRQLDAAVRGEDAKIQAYRRDKGLMRGANAPISSERLTSIGQQLSAAEAARAEAAARLREIRSGSSDAPAVLASRTIADLKQQLTVVNAQVASLSSQLGPTHPTLRAAQRERDNVRERYSEEVATIAASAQRAFDAADALVVSLRTQMETVKAEVAAATGDEAAIESMVRSVDIKRQQYSELYRRASELETERRVLLGSTRLVSLSELPTKPFFPKRLPFLAAGFTFAFLFAGAAAFLRDRADASVRASAELAVAGGVPIFAQLPRLHTRGRSRVFGAKDAGGDPPLERVLRDGIDDDAMQAALRKLYASLVLADASCSLRSLLLTSCGAREGKTFTTLALAQFVAATGRRVLIVECDMRRSTFADLLDIRAEPSLSAVLRGAVSPDDAVVRTGIPNLDAIPAGRSIADSTELLMSERLPDFLRWARSYDLVLLDSPPSSVLMDACILAKHVDGVLCCARWGRSSLAGTAATVERLRAAGGNVLGAVVTLVEGSDRELYESALPVRVLSGAA